MTVAAPARELRMVEALREALAEEMARDERVIVFGEDVGVYGGVFKVTDGLQARFGRDRVRDAPISELTIVGMALGAALQGLRPVPEIMYMDFFPLAMDQVVNNICHLRYVYGGQVKVPLVIRTQGGAGANATAQHSKSLEAWFMHTPGIKIAMPSTPADAKGLLKTAIRDDNPVIFIEHKLLYQVKGPVPEGEHLLPFGVADVKRPGRDVTAIATSRMVHEALAAADELSKEGIEVEVVDPRTLAPLDLDTLAASVRKTRRVAVVHESWRNVGIGAEIAARLGEECFDVLDAPVKRIAGLDVPIPFSEALEPLVIPNRSTIAAALRELAS